MMYTTEEEIEQLQKFMFQDKLKSLDEAIPGANDDKASLGDTIESDLDIENDVVERVSQEQVQNELWEMVSSTLNNDRMTDILCYRYINGLTLEAIGNRLGITRERVRQSESFTLSRLRRSSKMRKLVLDLNLWDEGKPFSINRIKLWCEHGRYQALDNKELAYAKRMGWVDEKKLMRA